MQDWPHLILSRVVQHAACLENHAGLTTPDSIKGGTACCMLHAFRIMQDWPHLILSRVVQHAACCMPWESCRTDHTCIYQGWHSLLHVLRIMQDWPHFICAEWRSMSLNWTTGWGWPYLTCHILQPQGGADLMFIWFCTMHSMVWHATPFKHWVRLTTSEICKVYSVVNDLAKWNYDTSVGYK